MYYISVSVLLVPFPEHTESTGIYYGKKYASSSIGGVDRYVIVRKLLDYEEYHLLGYDAV
jgi:hypothetical protein